jgi:hypothetical protein
MKINLLQEEEPLTGTHPPFGSFSKVLELSIFGFQNIGNLLMVNTFLGGNFSEGYKLFAYDAYITQ